MNDVASPAARLRRILVPAALILLVSLVGGCDEDPTGVPGLLVPDDYPTPQAAMDAAVAGERIVVRPGVYAYSEVRHIDDENYPEGVRAALFMKDGVFIESTSSDPGTVILRDTTDAPFTVGAVFSSVGENALINNLAFEDFSVGVLMTGQSGVVQNTRISDCPIGVHAVRAVDPAVVGCLVNRSDLAGILSEDVADAVYWLNHIRDCEVAIDIVGPDYGRIPTNLLCRNGVGLRMADGADPDVWYNGIQDNRLHGVLLRSGARPVVVQNDIFDNGIDFEVDVYAVPLDTLIDASTNYWNSVDTLEIASRILDRADDPSRGAFVWFKPVSPVLHFPTEVDVARLCAAESPYDDNAIMRALRRATSRTEALAPTARPAPPNDAIALRSGPARNKL